MRNLQELFEGITPENIKDIPVIRDSMQIFIDSLEEISSESIDSVNFFYNEEIKEELIKVYLQDLYDMLQAIQFNVSVVNAIKRENSKYPDGYTVLKVDAVKDVIKQISEEHFLTFKSYRESKGTAKGMRYIYDFVSNLLTEGNRYDTSSLSEFQGLTIKELKPFHFELEGELPKEIYEFVIYPLAHPLGFTYDYFKRIVLELIDYFPEVNIAYITKVLEVRTLHPDGTRTITPIIPNNDGIFVVDVVDAYTVDYRSRDIYLSDGTYYRQVNLSNGQTKVYLYEAGTNTLLKTFEDQSSIYFDYKFEVRTSVTDEMWTSIEPTISDHYPRMARAMLNCDLFVIGQTIKPNLFGEWMIGGCDYPDRDFGFNENRNRDGEILNPPSELLGRMEHAFYPSAQADFMELAGEYKLNTKIFDEDGNYLGLQPKTYTPYVVHDPKNVIIPRASLGSFLDYEEMNNRENPDYVAREYFDFSTVDEFFDDYKDIYDDQSLNDEIPKDITEIVPYLNDDYPEITESLDLFDADNIVFDKWNRRSFDAITTKPVVIGLSEVGGYPPNAPESYFKERNIPALVSDWVIGGSSEVYQWYELGYNPNLTVDGDLIYPPDYDYSRKEHSYNPTAWGDIQELLGNYTLKHDVIIDGKLVGVEAKKYGIRDENVIKCIDYVPTVEMYVKQNEHNFDYFANELMVSTTQPNDFIEEMEELIESSEITTNNSFTDNYEVEDDIINIEISESSTFSDNISRSNPITSRSALIGDDTLSGWVIGGSQEQIVLNNFRSVKGNLLSESDDIDRNENGSTPFYIDGLELLGNYEMTYENGRIIKVYGEEHQEGLKCVKSFDLETYTLDNAENTSNMCREYFTFEVIKV